MYPAAVDYKHHKNWCEIGAVGEARLTRTKIILNMLKTLPNYRQGLFAAISEGLNPNGRSCHPTGFRFSDGNMAKTHRFSKRKWEKNYRFSNRRAECFRIASESILSHFFLRKGIALRPSEKRPIFWSLYDKNIFFCFRRSILDF